MEYSKKVRARVRILVLTSSIAVALLFGLSFYFSLVSAESALASRVPELAELGERFKSTLMINTIVFAVIIIASFFVLGSLITDRFFKPLEGIERGLSTLSSGALPPVIRDSAGGPFASLISSYRAARARIEERERGEISTLEECLKQIGQGIDVTADLRTLIEQKKEFSGRTESANAEKSKPTPDDSVFMQSV